MPVPRSLECGLSQRFDDFFWLAFTFAHLARCAAAILLRPAAEMVRRLAGLTGFPLM